ncbi:MAG: FtsQ-type POTRA domain-containing protein [Eubacteriales bacterium]|nr:FtsQ-type POTRA domain-containing protein [Eubacteriales bacterium]
MAKNRDKQPKNDRDREKKKGFWSNFFEPVPSDEEYDPASANRQYGEPPEPPLKHLFDDEELDFSEEDDANSLAKLTWDDGEQVVSDSVRIRYTSEERETIRRQRETARHERAERGNATGPIHLFDGVEDDFDDDEEETAPHARTHTTRTRIFRTGSSTTARIHINETEETMRMHEAEKKARAREAARKHEEYVERQLRKKKKNAIAAKLFGNLMVVILMLVAVGVALYYGFLLSDIVVMGNEQFSTEYILKQSGLKLGTHMLFVDLDEVEADLSENPYLQVESVTYIFPSRVRIVVSERKEVAGIEGLDSTVIIDKNGYVLSMTAGADISDLIQVTGVSMTGYELGQRLGEGNDFSTATLVQLIAVLEQYSLSSSIKSIDLTTPLAITMTATNGLKIHVGQATDLESKMDVLSRILPQFFAKDVYTGTLYLSAKGGAVYSTTDYKDRTPVEVPDDTANTGGLLPVDADGDGLDDNTGLPYVAPQVDENGDGLDDNTGLPMASITPAAPITTPVPTTAGGDDDFQG